MKTFIKKNKNVEINITPLIDIVFLLLIFFMLATEFSDFKTIDMTTPIVRELNIKNDEPLLVELSSEGQIKINKILINYSNLEKQIKNFKKNQSDPQVMILTPEETEINILIKVMDAIRISGVNNIALITE